MPVCLYVCVCWVEMRAGKDRQLGCARAHIHPHTNACTPHMHSRDLELDLRLVAEIRPNNLRPE